jgi:hypothetical protein
MAAIATKLDNLYDDVHTIQTDVKELRESRYENGILSTSFDHQLGMLNEFRRKHELIHENLQEVKSQRQWQVWVIIIGAFISGFSGWIAYLMRT